jgi:Tfp pilus assembly protein PilZ
MVATHERRVHARVEEKSAINVTVLSVPGKHELENRTYAATTADLSAGGVRFTLPDLPPVGGTVELRIQCGRPPREFWHIGKVLWADAARASKTGYVVGVKFTDTPQATLALWSEVMRDKIARAGRDGAA